MGAGFARILHKKTGKKVAFGKPDEFIYYSDEIFTGNPKIATPDEVNAGLEVTWCPDTPSSRWYIRRKLPDGWLWNWETGLRPIPGEIWLTYAEVERGKEPEPYSTAETPEERGPPPRFRLVPFGEVRVSAHLQDVPPFPASRRRESCITTDRRAD